MDTSTGRINKGATWNWKYPPVAKPKGQYEFKPPVPFEERFPPYAKPKTISKSPLPLNNPPLGGTVSHGAAAPPPVKPKLPRPRDTSHDTAQSVAAGLARAIQIEESVKASSAAVDNFYYRYNKSQ